MQSAGDAMLLDTRIFHYGSANVSNTIRAQLRATYACPQQIDPCTQRHTTSTTLRNDMLC
jgi:hypothetical protein